MFRILSIDGGGIRGVFPAQVLECMQSRLDADVFGGFDMIAGTSTGSIIAAALAIGIKPSEILDLYCSKGGEIFGRKQRSLWPGSLKQGFHSKYQNGKLVELLQEVFEDKVLGDIDKPLLIPATDLGAGGVHVFKSSYCESFTRDRDVKVRDAVLASCSAPVFFDPVHVGNYLLADGGVWANNPGLAAVIDAEYRLGIDRTQLKVLSIGTGHSKTAYGTSRDRRWGLLNGWKHKNFVSFLLSLQAQSAHNYLQLMMEPDQLLRIDFESDQPLPLDDISAVGDLRSRADRVFTHMSDQVSQFLEISNGE